MDKLKISTWVAVVGVVVGLALALVFIGPDRLQGEVQRIFYIHFAAFYAALLAYGLALAGGLLYLIRREARWDTLALASVEVGVALSLVMITTGSVWARPVWNTWWTWDPRLTSAAVMVLTYAAYLMLRNAIDNLETRRRFAAVYGILALGTAIFTMIVIRIRPDTMYAAVIGPSAGSAANSLILSDRMATVLIINTLVWALLLTPVLIGWRMRLEQLYDKVRQHQANIYP